MKTNAALLLALFGLVAAADEDPLFSPSYFWMWSHRLEPAKLIAQLEDMRAHGLRNVCIHPFPKAFRPGLFHSEMEPDYLTKEYLDVFAKVVKRAGELGMHAYLYDEGGWPSGGACGLVAAEDAEGRLMPRSIGYGDDGTNVFGVYRREYRPNRAPYPSIIEKGTTDRFIALTHEAYAKVLGKDLGSTVRVAFMDEPQRPGGWDGFNLGWTGDFPEVFKAKKGYDILPHVKEMIARHDDTDDRLARLRIDYQEVMADLFADRFMLPIRDWCRAHGVLSGGHLNGEDVPERTASYGHGNLMRSLRAMDVPGVDAIWRQIFPATATHEAVTPPYPRYASSAMHQNGGRYALSETFGIYGDSVTPAQMKWVVDYQMMRGINTFVFGYYGMSTAGQWMNLFEPLSGPVTPYWDFESHWFGYIERTAAMLSRGRPGAEIAVLYDVRGLWAGGADREAAAWNHSAAARALDRMNCDYDFTDDESIAAATVTPDGLKVGAMTYRTIVLPTRKWMLPAAKTRLDEFVRAGGRVVGNDELGRIPRTLTVRCAGSTDIRVAKRVDGDVRIYALMNECPWGNEVEITFPEGGRVVRYDAERNRYEAATENGRVKRVFGGGELAIFLTGDVPDAVEPAAYAPVDEEDSGITEGWTLRRLVSHELSKDDFEIRRCDESARPVRLGDWRTVLGSDFSGKALYRVEFDATTSGKALLDLGAVKWCAALRLNGKDCGVRFFGPFQWEVELKEGKNVLEVTVANLLVNQVGRPEVRDRIARDFPPRSVYDGRQAMFDFENKESGLFGPVIVRECMNGTASKP